MIGCSNTLNLKKTIEEYRESAFVYIDAVNIRQMSQLGEHEDLTGLQIMRKKTNEAGYEKSHNFSLRLHRLYS